MQEQLVLPWVCSESFLHACLAIILQKINLKPTNQRAVSKFWICFLNKHNWLTEKLFRNCEHLISSSHVFTIYFTNIYQFSEVKKEYKSFLSFENQNQYLAHVIEQPNLRIPNPQYLQQNFCFDFFNDSENKFWGFFKI